MANEEFGCERCWPADADAAWEARGSLTREAELVDESHFHAMLLSCGACGQRFVSVFTETVDWEGGDDPQQWNHLPVTAGEAARLRPPVTEAVLDALGPGRRCLRRDFPRDAEQPRVSWTVGMQVGLHD